MTMLRDASTMLASLFSLVLFMILFESRYSRKRTVTLTASLMLPLLVVNFVLLLVLGPEVMSTLVLVTCSLPSLLFFWFLARHRDGRFFFTFFMADTMILEILHVTAIMDYFLGNIYVFMAVARAVLCLMLAFAIWHWVKPVYVDVQNQVSKGWYTFTFIALIFYITLSLSLSVPTIITSRLEQLPAHVLLLVLMPAIYIHIFTTLRRQQQAHELLQNENILTMHVANMTARIEELSASDDLFRMERHNYRHQLNTIASLVESKRYDELHALVGQYSQSIQDTKVVRYCSHAVIDAVLATYLAKAESKGIHVTCAVHFPDELHVNEAELATVFANAIDNAIYACKKLPKAKRQLEIKVLTIPHFMIQISNSFEGHVAFDEKGMPIAKRAGHGFGTRYIAAFCEKNKAFFEFKTENHRFCLRILFP